MRVRVLFSGVATLLALSGCSTTTPGGAAQSGGTTSSGGQDQSGGAGGSSGSGGTTSSAGGTTSSAGGATSSAGGTTSSAGGATGSGGITAKGGTTSNGGRASGGTTLTGGIISSGGQQGGGGVTARGGTTSSGGATASGGSTGSGGQTGAGGTEASYQGPCDLLSGGCAEAYSVTSAMTSRYKGPLFQLGRTRTRKGDVDIGQTAAHAADMRTWSADCGGTSRSAWFRKYTRKMHKGNNDLFPPSGRHPGVRTAARAATPAPRNSRSSPRRVAHSHYRYAAGICACG